MISAETIQGALNIRVSRRDILRYSAGLAVAGGISAIGCGNDKTFREGSERGDTSNRPPTTANLESVGFSTAFRQYYTPFGNFEIQEPLNWDYAENNYVYKFSDPTNIFSGLEIRYGLGSSLGFHGTVDELVEGAVSKSTRNYEIRLISPSGTSEDAVQEKLEEMSKIRVGNKDTRIIFTKTYNNPGRKNLMNATAYVVKGGTLEISSWMYYDDPLKDSDALRLLSYMEVLMKSFRFIE